MNLAEATALVNSVPHWHHRFEVFPGLVTPGSYSPQFMLDMLQLPDVLTGLKVLDVGPSDGFFSMSLARRGAIVTAVDYRPKSLHGFGVMERITGLPLTYHQANLYDITEAQYGKFDIVLFLGVLYHLPDMIRSLDILRRVCAGQFFVETECEPDLTPGIAAARYYEAASLAGDASNFWSPNRECVHAMLRDCGFQPHRTETLGRRLLVRATVVGHDRTEKMRIGYGVM